MFRRWLVLILLVLQLQPVLAFMPERAGELAVALEHEVMHQGLQGHHHGDDLRLQADDDGSPLTHVHHDASHHGVLPLVPGPGLAAMPASAAPIPFGRCCIPSPCLEGPLRPPRSGA
jgi:hypothetical protein